MNWRLMTIIAQFFSLVLWVVFLCGLILSMQPSQSFLDNILVYGFAVFVILYAVYIWGQVQKYRKGPEAKNVPSPFKAKIFHLFSLMTKNIGIITNLAYLAFMVGALIVFVNSRVNWSLFDYAIIVAFSAVLIIFIIYGVLPRSRVISKPKSKKKV